MELFLTLSPRLVWIWSLLGQRLQLWKNHLFFLITPPSFLSPLPPFHLPLKSCLEETEDKPSKKSGFFSVGTLLWVWGEALRSCRCAMIDCCGPSGFRGYLSPWGHLSPVSSHPCTLPPFCPYWIIVHRVESEQENQADHFKYVFFGGLQADF